MHSKSAAVTLHAATTSAERNCSACAKMPPCEWPERRRVRFRNTMIAWFMTGASLVAISIFKSGAQSDLRKTEELGDVAPQRFTAHVDLQRNAWAASYESTYIDVESVEGTSIVQVASGVAGGSFTSFRLFLKLGPSALSAYAIYGFAQDPLTFPPAYQCPAPFGVNIGGTRTHRRLLVCRIINQLLFACAAASFSTFSLMRRQSD